MCVFLCPGCTEKEEKTLEVNPSSIIVYSEGTQQLTTNVDDASFITKDDYYATVSTTGLVTGERVGSTEIIVKSSIGSYEVPIKILNKYSLYPDVDRLIGKNISDMVNLFGSDYKTSTTSSGAMMYGYANPTRYVELIAFTMNGSTIKSVGVVVPTSYTSMLTKYLLERYMVAGMQNDMYFFLNHDENVMIGLEVYSSQYLMVIYVDATSSKASNTNTYFFQYREIYNESIINQ